MKIFVVILILVFCFQQIYSQKTNSKIPYYPNEEVDFSLRYGFLIIGNAHLEYSYNNNCEGATIIACIKSAGLLKLINNIHWQYECCMDTSTGLPLTDSRILIDGDYADISTVYYDHSSRKDSSIIYSKNTDTVVCPPNIYDVLSGFFNYRANYLPGKMPINHSVTITTFFIDEIWHMSIKYCGKETIKTKYGPVECFEIKPLTIEGHFFRSTDAISIWFTNNRDYTPVKFTIDSRLGTLHGDITNYKRPKY